MKRLLFLSCLLISSCKTMPVVIDTIETDKIATDTIVSGKDLETTINDIKVITDYAKQTGEIKQPEKIIEYVDKASGQVAQLNGKIFDLENSRKDDNKKHAEIIASFSAQVAELKEQLSSSQQKVIILGAIVALFLICSILIIIGKLKRLF